MNHEIIGVAVFYLYVLKCRDGSLYTGYTNDLEKRVRMHSDGKASKYTRSRRPVRLVLSESFATKSGAMKAESAFKRLPRSQKLRRTGGNKY